MKETDRPLHPDRAWCLTANSVPPSLPSNYAPQEQPSPVPPPAQDPASALSHLPDHQVLQQGRGQSQTLRAEGRTSLRESSWHQHEEKEAEPGQGRLSEGLTPQLESSRAGMTSPSRQDFPGGPVLPTQGSPVQSHAVTRSLTACGQHGKGAGSPRRVLTALSAAEGPSPYS